MEPGEGRLRAVSIERNNILSSVDIRPYHYYRIVFCRTVLNLARCKTALQSLNKSKRHLCSESNYYRVSITIPWLTWVVHSCTRYFTKNYRFLLDGDQYRSSLSMLTQLLRRKTQIFLTGIPSHFSILQANLHIHIPLH